METQASEAQFAICVKNGGYEASLEVRKVYRVLPDAWATARGLLRVIDESGEDYVYPADYLIPIALPQSLVETLFLVA